MILFVMNLSNHIYTLTSTARTVPIITLLAVKYTENALFILFVLRELIKLISTLILHVLNNWLRNP